MSNKVIIYQPAIKICQLLHLLPKESDSYYHLKFYFFIFPFSCSIIFTSSLSTWYMILIRKEIVFHVLLENLTMTISMIGILQIIVYVYINKNKILNLLNELEDYSKFGTPHDVEEIVKIFKHVVQLSFIYSAGGSLIYWAYGLIDAKVCNEINFEHDMEFVCGFFVFAWYPFNVNYFPMKQIISIALYLNGILVMANATINIGLIFGIILNINSRVRHLRYLFGQAFNCTNKIECRRQMILCYEYHKDILRLADNLNLCYSSVALLNILWAGIVLGISGYQFLLEYTPGSLIHLTGWLVSLFALSLGGQMLIDESVKLQTDLFSSNWYDKDILMQKEVQFVLLKLRKPLHFKGKDFGVMNFETFKGVIKSAYQFLTLLSQTI